MLPSSYRWYPKVLDDLSKALDAIDHYDSVIPKAFEDLALEGNLVRLSQAQPGLRAYYGAMRADLKSILDLVEASYESVKAKKIKEWLKSPPVDGKIDLPRLKMLLDADEDVEVSARLAGVVRDMHDRFGAICSGFDDRSYRITNLTNLHVGDKQDVEI